jgi:predicted transcriptional regulator
MAADDIIEVLGNKYNPEILEATAEPKSAQELSEELDVPIATCYRRINELTEVDLLELHDQPLSEEHRRIKVYRRCIDEVSIDGLEVELQERSDVKNKLDEVWRRMSQG